MGGGVSLGAHQPIVSARSSTSLRTARALFFPARPAFRARNRAMRKPTIPALPTARTLPTITLFTARRPLRSLFSRFK